MIGISTITANASGSIVIHETPESEIRTLDARVSRIATLDGGAVIVNSGASDSDRTLFVKSLITETEETILKDIFEGGALVHISTDIGFFSGAISRFKPDNGELEMTILTKAKLSA